MIRKRDGREVPYDGARIKAAVYKAAQDLVSDSWAQNLGAIVEGEIAERLEEFTSVEEISDAVERLILQENELEVARCYMLWRYRKAMLRESGAPDPRALSDYIFHSKYAKPGEDWDACIDRCRNMHLRNYAVAEGPLYDTIMEAFELVRQKKVLPSMRSLQFGGAAIEANNARMFNCSFSHCDRIEFFSELFFLLLSGCGVGYSVQRCHVEKLPEFQEIDRTDTVHLTVVDTIEGWADAVFSLFNAATVGSYVEFIYSRVRPLGSPLVTSGGVAPGHVPLKEMLEKVRGLIPVGKMTPFIAHRIACSIAEAVLAGGIRRSSLICLFDADDQEIPACKTGDWAGTMPELAMANNSVVILDDDEMPEYFFDLMREWGEPGFFRTSSIDYGTNPCGEIGLNPVYGTDLTGFAFCNLTEVPAKHLSRETVRAAVIIGTLQAGYTHFPYLREESKLIAERDALLGVSVTGVMDQEIEWDGLREYAREVNREIAEMLGINEAARITCIKPSGTASLLLGNCGSGHHPHHAKRYFRRVVANAQEPAFQAFHETNPHMCEQKDDGGWVITFPILAPDGARTRDNMTAIELMEAAQDTHQQWIEEGPLQHNVSLTVTVKDDEWDDVEEWVRVNCPRSMAFLPYSGDKKYPHAPFEAVVDVGDEARWKDLIAKQRPVNYGGAGAVDVGAACEGGRCEV